ncbi:MAG: helix-turn-helix transcriptional regulator [Caldilineaceae bacterium]|nr:helix-turn-helix transcriptional regulator [Caldilineaceae bacterium]
MDHTGPIIENLSSELRRGLLALAILAQCRQPQYGYSLKQVLAEAGMDVNEGTLYPLLRRLEEQKLLDSEWQLAGESRPRRYYRINAAGEAALAALTTEWRLLAASMDRLLADTKE